MPGWVLSFGVWVIGAKSKRELSNFRTFELAMEDLNDSIESFSGRAEGSPMSCVRLVEEQEGLALEELFEECRSP